jgi:hypothetical protein
MNVEMYAILKSWVEGRNILTVVCIAGLTDYTNFRRRSIQNFSFYLTN